MTQYLVTRMQFGIVCMEMTEKGIKPHSNPKTFAEWKEAAQWMSPLGISGEQLAAVIMAIGEGENAVVSVLQ